MTNGVLNYVEATARIFFEKDKVCCRYCPLLSETPRYQCRGTGSYLTDINVTGMWCPLVIKEDIIDDL